MQTGRQQLSRRCARRCSQMRATRSPYRISLRRRSCEPFRRALTLDETDQGTAQSHAGKVCLLPKAINFWGITPQFLSLVFACVEGGLDALQCSIGSLAGALAPFSGRLLHTALPHKDGHTLTYAPHWPKCAVTDIRQGVYQRTFIDARYALHARANLSFTKVGI